MKINYIFFLAFVSTAGMLKPTAKFGEKLIEEIKQTGSSAITYINLQNKGLIFASNSEIFDKTLAKDIVDTIIKCCPNIEMLDLSFCRLPMDALETFIPLLKMPNFKYLDVCTTGGADCIDAIRNFSIALAKTVAFNYQSNIMKKIIWLDKDLIERAEKSLIVPKVYTDAHQDYYKLKKIDGFNTTQQLPQE